jgi:hypothetical protein
MMSVEKPKLALRTTRSVEHPIDRDNLCTCFRLAKVAHGGPHVRLESLFNLLNYKGVLPMKQIFSPTSNALVYDCVSGYHSTFNYTYWIVVVVLKIGATRWLILFVIDSGVDCR